MEQLASSLLLHGVSVIVEVNLNRPCLQTAVLFLTNLELAGGERKNKMQNENDKCKIPRAACWREHSFSTCKVREEGGAEVAPATGADIFPQPTNKSQWILPEGTVESPPRIWFILKDCSL